MSTENLNQQEALEKLKAMVDKIDIGMLCTYPEDGYVHSVPMSRQEIDEEGNIRFLFSSESETFKHLQHEKKISLLYSDISNYNFLSINGVAEISKDQALIDKYWNKMMEAWFEKGQQDPHIRILKVIPSQAHYWDNKTNKLVTLFKVALSAISGKKMDIGREGDLNL
ncbi:MAG: hypothetical protein K0R65_1071 [Crocinitomicaceae bacterium]|jgi:general stress protein 26|nr:hypothetical protein [Crocinitomicaceae bacterium]